MPVNVTREHSFAPDEVDAKLEQAVEQMAAQNGLNIIDRAERRMKIAGMGVNGEVTWDDKEITISAQTIFGFGAMDAQVRTAIEAALNRICGPQKKQ